MSSVATAAVAVQEPKSKGELRDVPVDLIQKGRYQPRVEFKPGELEDLAASICQVGVVQPIVVRPVGKKFELVAGERRWRAAQMADLHEIPAVVRTLSDEQTAIFSLIENVQREDLKPLEIADYLQRLINEFDLTHAAVAEWMGYSRVKVTNYLRLLDLGADARELLNKGELEAGHAKVLAGVEEPLQGKLARDVVAKGWSVRHLEKELKKARATGPVPGPEHSADPNVRRLEEHLSNQIGNAVRIDVDQKSRGSMTIKFNSLEELQGQLQSLFNYSSD